MEIADVDNNRSYALQFVVAHFLILPTPGLSESRLVPVRTIHRGNGTAL